MPPRNQKRHEGWLRGRVLDVGGEQVGLHVVHAHDGDPRGVGGRLRPAHPHQQGSDQPGAGCHADAVEFRQHASGFVQRTAHDVVDHLQMSPRGEFRNHAAVDGVHVLGEDHV